MNRPLVSVIMLTYNSAEKFLNRNDVTVLKQSLDALVGQDYSNIEILIFDDKSSDSSYKICREYESKNRNIRVFQNDENVGVIKNLFKAIEHVEGKYFLWACPDDTWSENFVSETVALLEEQKDLVAAMSKIKVVSDYAEPYYIEYASLSSIVSQYELAKHVVAGSTCSYNQYIHGLIRTEFLRKVFIENRGIWIVEELIVVLMVFYGGLGYVKDALHTNFHTQVSLAERNPLIYQLRKDKMIELKGMFCFVKEVVLSNLSFVLKLQFLSIIPKAFYNHYLHKPRFKMKEKAFNVVQALKTMAGNNKQ